MAKGRTIGFGLMTAALVVPALATADEGAVRYPEQICTVTEAGEAECVPLRNLPSKALIERLLLELAGDGEAELSALHCKGGEGTRLETPPAKPQARRLPRHRRTVDPVQWSVTSVERAEQNLLALLRSCHAHHTGGVDPVEAGQVPAGAEPFVTPLEPTEETAAEPTEATAAEPADEVEGAPALEGQGDDAPEPAREETEDSEDGEVVLAESDDAEGDLGLALADATLDGKRITIKEAAAPTGLELPSRVQIVAGYDELRPRVRQLVVTWMEGVSQASFGMDPCNDPIAMPTLGECELSL